ncbi:MAG: Prophage CP4-57 regulatory protein (AlpA) [Syntrophorhabdus sp. PtaU1.Bin153]|nr:MAG: Prophage CP4-57 regulatory protein (AlpA) [Syntrophorhabdus sp. PtaU1.Bin153]
MGNTRFLRLPQVLERIPVSKSTWWAGIRKGIFPKGVKLSARITAWRETDIDAICERAEGALHRDK